MGTSYFDHPAPVLPSGQEWAATHYTAVGTCRHLGLDPFAYLRDVLPRLHDLGDQPAAEQLTPLLLDRWLAGHPGHALCGLSEQPQDTHAVSSFTAVIRRARTLGLGLASAT